MLTKPTPVLGSRIAERQKQAEAKEQAVLQHLISKSTPLGINKEPGDVLLSSNYRKHAVCDNLMKLVKRKRIISLHFNIAE